MTAMPPHSRRGGWLTASQVAARIGVHPRTVIRWADDGKIAVTRTLPTGERQWSEDAVQEIEAAMVPASDA